MFLSLFKVVRSLPFFDVGILNDGEHPLIIFNTLSASLKKPSFLMCYLFMASFLMCYLFMAAARASR